MVDDYNVKVSAAPPAEASASRSAPRSTELEGVRPGPRPWQRRLFIVIFGHHTRAGRWFDVTLLVAILASTLAVMLDSVNSIRERHGPLLYAVEWGFTILFSIEYLLRVACVARRRRYIFSFFGVVDLLAILPTFASLYFTDARALTTVRALRLLRVFRVLKLVRFVGEAAVLRAAIWQSRQKVAVFLLAVFVIVTILGSLMHLVESPSNPGFTSIPQSIYWAIVTMATVGYGDVVPQTPMGKFLSAMLIVIGYSLIVVPTGIVSSELSGDKQRQSPAPPCPTCSHQPLDPAARYCDRCGGEL